MKATTITIKHAVAAARRQKWQQRNTNVNLNFFHNCRSDRSAPSLSTSYTHLRRRIVCDAARGCDVRVRACVHVCVLCAVLPCWKWTLLWNVFSILCPLSTPLKQNSNAGADVDSGVGGSGSGCYCGCELWHQKCWPHFPTLHCPLPLSPFCTCGCGDRPSDTARRNVQGWGRRWCWRWGAGNVFSFACHTPILISVSRSQFSCDPISLKCWQNTCVCVHVCVWSVHVRL